MTDDTDANRHRCDCLGRPAMNLAPLLLSTWTDVRNVNIRRVWQMPNGDTFDVPAWRRQRFMPDAASDLALRDWLPCWFGGLDQAAKDET